MPLIYVNGELVEEAAATVSALDHGLVTGDGVFETVLIRDGRTFALRRHLDRLVHSAEALAITVSPELRRELETAASDVTRCSALGDGKLRITLTAGRGPLASSRGDGPPTVIVAAGAIDPRGGHAMAGVCAVAPWPRNERGALAGAKTISYAENVVALAWAHSRGATEALFGNLAGNVCEGTGSNIFLVRAGRLLTPPLSSGCLAGVTRALVLESGLASEEDVPIQHLAEVTEAFLCSTTRGVQPVARVDDRDLGECPGPATRAAAEYYDELLAKSDEP